jgi:uncharacterized membrane protein (DUF485 family)
VLHEPASSNGPDYAIEYKSRLGAWMFLLYSAVYVGFVVINVVKPLAMEKIICFGLNLAVVYGFALIIFALVLAVIYNSMCGKKEKEGCAPANKKQGGK